MTMDTSPTAQGRERSHASLRWLFILIASALLHLIVMSWINGVIHLSSFDPSDRRAVITATLTAPPKPVVTAAARSKPKRSMPAHPLSPQITTPSEIPPVVGIDPTTIARAMQAVDTANGKEMAEANAASGSTDTSLPVNVQSSESYKINLPPSADLKYDLKKVSKEGQPMYGNGTISWHTDGSTYTVDGNFGILFITALTFKSAGTIEDFGIAPELYSEKRFRRAETNTHFNRERNVISFSSSTLSYPRTGGEQDRATIVWQLAGIGRGDSGKFVPGAVIDLFVAGIRDAETWHIRVIGQEDITVDGTSMHAWHVVRAPRAGSYDQILDIWLAPGQNWYPVRLRYTESNGDYLDMSLSSLNVSAVP